MHDVRPGTTEGRLGERGHTKLDHYLGSPALPALSRDVGSTPFGMGIPAGLGAHHASSREASPNPPRFCWGAGPRPNTSPPTSRSPDRSTSPQRSLSPCRSARNNRSQSPRRSASPKRRVLPRPGPAVKAAPRKTCRTGTEDLFNVQPYKEERGVRQRAYDDLQSRNPRDVKVHDVPTIQKIPSGVHRVDVKLHYLRRQNDLAYDLVKPIEQDFMAVEPFSGEWVVDVGKISCMSSQGRGSSETMVNTSGPSRFKRCRVYTPEVKAVIQEARAAKHSDRVRRAVQSAREQEMQKRCKHLEMLEHRQARYGLAARSRPWLSSIIITLAFVAMRKIADQYNVECGRESQLKVHCENFSSGVEILRKYHLQAIMRLAWRSKLDDVAGRKKDRIWQFWSKTLRIVIWLTRMLRPRRKHVAMELCKRSLIDGQPIFLLRKALKVYMAKVCYCQRAWKHQCAIWIEIKRRLLEPEVWAAETLVLSRAAGLDEENVLSEITLQMDLLEVEVWRAKLQEMINNRRSVWGSMTSAMQESRLLSRPIPQKKRPSEIMTASKSNSTKMKMIGRSGQGALNQAKKTGVLGDPAMAKYFPTIGGLGHYRLPVAERRDLVRRVHMERIEIWWTQYKQYRKYKIRHLTDWKMWLETVQEVSQYDPEFWPEPPETAAHPEIILKPASPMLEGKLLIVHKVYQKTRDSQGYDALLSGCLAPTAVLPE